MASKAQHVVPRQKGWSVRRSGAARASSNHSTQAEAIAAGTRIAQNNKTELYIHGSDGRIRERHSYGADRQAPKG